MRRCIGTRKIQECLKKQSRLVLDGISRERTKSMCRGYSAESIGSVDTDSEDERFEDEEEEEKVSFLKFQFSAEIFSRWAWSIGAIRTLRL